MSTECCVFNCKSNVSTNHKLSFFRFPADPKRCDVWLALIGRKDLKSLGHQFLHRNRKICSLHFESHMFAGLCGNRLLRDAVPTVFANNTGCIGVQTKPPDETETVPEDPLSIVARTKPPDETETIPEDPLSIDIKPSMEFAWTKLPDETEDSLSIDIKPKMEFVQDADDPQNLDTRLRNPIIWDHVYCKLK